MSTIAIIGNNLVGLFCAGILSDNNEVLIINSELELGFPASFPGSSNDINFLKNFLSDQQTNQLFVKDSLDSSNFRSEWFSKLITHKLAKKGVLIANRTRISDINNVDGNLILSTTGGYLNVENFECKIILDFSEYSYNPLASKTHQYKLTDSNIIKPKIDTKQFFVGICLESEAHNLSKYQLKLPRNDGLVETWYDKDNLESPTKGWIESKTIKAYFESKIMLVEDYFIKAQEICKNMVIK